MAINFYNQLKDPPNYDQLAKIHYGVISEQSLDPEACNEIFYEGVDLCFEAYQDEVKNRLRNLYLSRDTPKWKEDVWSLVDQVVRSSLKKQVEEELLELFADILPEKEDEGLDQLWQVVEQEVSDGYQADSSDYRLEKGGYIITTCLQSDLMVIKSPFFSYAPPCSPCCPNAGDLDSAETYQELCNLAAQRGYSTHLPSAEEHQVFAELKLKTFCFDKTWFLDNIAPYPIFDVRTGERIL